MRELYQNRLKDYQKELIKYSKYIFNDHFSIVLLFLIGSLSYYYVQILEMIKVGNLLAKVIIVIALFFVAQLGKLNLLTQEADMTFLLVKERQIKDYFNASLKASMIFPIIINFLLILVITPVYIKVTDFLVYNVLALFFIQIIEKIIQYRITIYLFYNNNRNIKSIFYIQYIILLICTQFISPIVILVFTLLVLIGSFYLFKIKSILNWEQMIVYEQTRKRRVYQFISMFTDVPNMPSKVSRKKYLDIFLKEKNASSATTYLYLFKHSFFRNNDYFHLVFRLNIIAIVAIIAINNIWIVLAVSLVMLYLIGFQLIPLNQHFKNQLLTAIYPISIDKKKDNLIKFIYKVLVFSSVVLGIVTLIRFLNFYSIIYVFILFLFCYIFSKIYLPKRII